MLHEKVSVRDLITARLLPQTWLSGPQALETDLNRLTFGVCPFRYQPAIRCHFCGIEPTFEPSIRTLDAACSLYRVLPIM
jgi:hypothetical protein